jgi:DNA-binding HxlR family transcriptional regulator
MGNLRDSQRLVRGGLFPSGGVSNESRVERPLARLAGGLPHGARMRFIKSLCPRYQTALEILGKRWTGLILDVLLEGPQRFSCLATRLAPVSERMLSERLKELEAHGIVEHRVVSEVPARAQYELTEKGRALSEVLGAIGRWAERWVEVPDSHSDTG